MLGKLYETSSEVDKSETSSVSSLSFNPDLKVNDFRPDSHRNEESEDLDASDVDLKDLLLC